MMKTAFLLLCACAAFVDAGGKKGSAKSGGSAGAIADRVDSGSGSGSGEDRVDMVMSAGKSKKSKSSDASSSSAKTAKAKKAKKSKGSPFSQMVAANQGGVAVGACVIGLMVVGTALMVNHRRKTAGWTELQSVETKNKVPLVETTPLMSEL